MFKFSLILLSLDGVDFPKLLIAAWIVIEKFIYYNYFLSVDDEMSPFFPVKVSLRVHLKKQF